jgi:hypothetical protein
MIPRPMGDVCIGFRWMTASFLSVKDGSVNRLFLSEVSVWVPVSIYGQERPLCRKLGSARPSPASWERPCDCNPSFRDFRNLTTHGQTRPSSRLIVRVCVA